MGSTVGVVLWFSVSVAVSMGVGVTSGVQPGVELAVPTEGMTESMVSFEMTLDTAGLRADDVLACGVTADNVTGNTVADVLVACSGKSLFSRAEVLSCCFSLEFSVGDLDSGLLSCSFVDGDKVEFVVNIEGFLHVVIEIP